MTSASPGSAPSIPVLWDSAAHVTRCQPDFPYTAHDCVHMNKIGTENHFIRSKRILSDWERHASSTLNEWYSWGLVIFTLKGSNTWSQCFTKQRDETWLKFNLLAQFIPKHVRVQGAISLILTIRSPQWCEHSLCGTHLDSVACDGGALPTGLYVFSNLYCWDFTHWSALSVVSGLDGGTLLMCPLDWNITSHMIPTYKCSPSVLWAWYLLNCMKNSLKTIPLTTYTLSYCSDLWSPTKDTTSKWPLGHDQCILHALAVSSKGIRDLSQFITLFLIGLCSSPCWEMCSVDHLPF